MNLDTLSSDSSEDEIRDSGSSFLFPDSWGSGLYFPYFGKYSSLPGGGGGGGGGGELIYINMYAPVSYWQVHAYCCHTGLSIYAPLPLW